eukprot:6195719-Pleurochrysis_carterae.AAC.3
MCVCVRAPGAGRGASGGDPRGARRDGRAARSLSLKDKLGIAVGNRCEAARDPIRAPRLPPFPPTSNPRHPPSFHPFSHLQPILPMFSPPAEVNSSISRAASSCLAQSRRESAKSMDRGGGAAVQGGGGARRCVRGRACA